MDHSLACYSVQQMAEKTAEILGELMVLSRERMTGLRWE